MFVIPSCSMWGWSLIGEFCSGSSSPSVGWMCPELNADAPFSTCLYSPVEGTSGGCSPLSFFCLIHGFSSELIIPGRLRAVRAGLGALPETASALSSGSIDRLKQISGPELGTLSLPHYFRRKSQTTQRLLQIYAFIKASWLKSDLNFLNKVGNKIEEESRIFSTCIHTKVCQRHKCHHRFHAFRSINELLKANESSR